MKCIICFGKIHVFYYKNKCPCKIYYHLECIEKLYKYRKKCVTCNKKINTSFYILIKKKNIFYQVILYIIIVFMLFLIIEFLI